MSGGFFEYNQYHLNEMAEKLEYLIENNNKKDEFGYSTDYPDKIIKIFSQVKDELRIMSEKIHRLDYLICDDYGVDTFLEKWNQIKKSSI
ncbi:MAG: hypothetical protein ACOC1K_03120 [Nanoarchaeota archaeon]